MFFREKRSGQYTYLQIVENRWEEGRARQRVLLTVGRLDTLQEEGKLDSLLATGARFSDKMIVLSAYRQGKLKEGPKKHIGPAMVFERLWQEAGCAEVIGHLASDRKFGFSAERAIFATVLHRLVNPGSDRACEKWLREQGVLGAQALKLHHFYRAMAWLGEALPDSEQSGATPFAPRCTKDLVEEALFQRRRTLFSSLSLCFFDTTSIYFEGEGGESIGRLGHTKDHRPDLKQMVAGAVLDGSGNPMCCEMWPGNTADVKTLVPISGRLKGRFGIREACVVADRGMISSETLRWLEAPSQEWTYILGARMRKQREVTEEVLSRAGRYQEVHPPRRRSKDPSPLEVKEVLVDGRRYIVCRNEEQARRDAAVREAILLSLEEKLKRGDKSLVGNKGYRKYLKARGSRFEIDLKKAQTEARYDGKWVLRTNTQLPAAEVAMKYKQLWMVERLFRSVKSMLATRPVYHKHDETIRGHVFCSFLALLLMKELEDRIARKGYDLEWADVIEDLSELEEAEIEQDGKRALLRLGATGCAGKVFQAAGVAMPPTLRLPGETPVDT